MLMRGRLISLCSMSILALVLSHEMQAQTQTKWVETETPLSLQRQGKIYALNFGVSDCETTMINDRPE